MSPRAPRVAVVGGGLVGLASALACREAGADVAVFERDPAPRGASAHAAGIVGAQLEAHGPGPLAELCLASRARYEAFARGLERASGLATGFGASGSLRAYLEPGALAAGLASAAWQLDRGLRVERLDGARARALEPALAPGVLGGLFYPDDAVVDPPALLAAAREAARRAGITLRDGAPVVGVDEAHGRVTGVRVACASVTERFACDAVVVAAGSWSHLLEGSTVAPGAITPARGQIAELRAEAPLRRVVQGAVAYLSPRDDGRVIVGSTLEFVGHREGNTAGAVTALLADAIALAPTLERAEVSRLWSSFRPYAPDELPLLGRAPVRGLVIATGHYRNGVLLAPVTGAIVAALALGAPLPHDVSEALLAAFAPGRPHPPA